MKTNRSRSHWMISSLLVLLSIGMVSCRTTASGKKTSISSQDKRLYRRALTEYTLNICNAVTQKNKKDQFYEVNYSDVPIPIILIEDFTDSAIEKYFKEAKLERIRSWMSDLSWQWKAEMVPRWQVPQRGGMSKEVPALKVDMKNTAPLEIKGIKVYLVGQKKEYVMMSKKPLQPKEKGIFVAEITPEEFKFLRTQSESAILTRVFW